jgi:hypothetical protein
MNFKKNVIVDRTGYSPVQMKVNIKDKNLFVELSSEIAIIDLARYLLEHTPMLDKQVKRVCPYKLRVEKHHENGSFAHRTYIVDYLESQNGKLVEKSTPILTLYGCNMKVKGKLRVYIPDLLLAFQERGYVSLQYDETFAVSRKFNTDVTFSEDLLSAEELKNKGYIIPSNYVKKLPTIAPLKNPNKALVIAIKDNSGSMSSWENHVSTEYYDLAIESIKKKYNDVEEWFVSHSTEATLSSKAETFSKGMMGGTIVSSAFRLLKDKLSTDREVIILQFSDGDNLTSDNARVLKMLTEDFLPNVKYFKYIELNQYKRHSTLMSAYRNIKEKNFSCMVAIELDDSLKGFRLRDELEKLK